MVNIDKYRVAAKNTEEEFIYTPPNCIRNHHTVVEIDRKILTYLN